MLTPEEIREMATEIILDHARDVEYLTIAESLPKGLSAAEADLAARRIDDLIARAAITVELPGTPERQAPPATAAALLALIREQQAERQEADAKFAAVAELHDKMLGECARHIPSAAYDGHEIPETAVLGWVRDVAGELERITRERDSLARRLNIRCGELSQVHGELSQARADRDGLRQQLETESTVSHGLRLELEQRREDLAKLREELAATEAAERDRGTEYRECKQRLDRTTRWAYDVDARRMAAERDRAELTALLVDRARLAEHLRTLRDVDAETGETGDREQLADGGDQ